MCKDEDKFLEIKGSLHNLTIITEYGNLGPYDCETICRNNCSCTAFASLEDNEIGCEFYYGDKKNLLNMTGKGNSTVYVRGGSPIKSGKCYVLYRLKTSKSTKDSINGSNLVNYFSLH